MLGAFAKLTNVTIIFVKFLMFIGPCIIVIFEE